MLTGSSLEYLGNCLELQGMIVEQASSAKIFTQLFTTFHTSFLSTQTLFSIFKFIFSTFLVTQIKLRFSFFNCKPVKKWA